MKELPSWTTLDPAAPPGMSELSGGGCVVGIVATGGAHTDGWALGVVARVAEAWSAGGIRLILADGALADPKLHIEVGIENGEGVADALVFGASVRRVACRVEGHGYFVVAAGTVVADPSEAMSGGRWAHLCSGFRDAGVMLAVYLRAEDPSTVIALQEASHVLVVASEGEEVPGVVMDCAAPVIGVVGVAAGEVPEAPADDEAEEVVPEEVVEAEEAEAPDLAEPDDLDFGVPVGVAEADSESPTDDALDLAPLAGLEEVSVGGDDAEAALFARAMEAAESDEGEGSVAPFEVILQETEGGKVGGRRTAGLLLVLVLVILGALGAEWFGYIDIPGLTLPGSAAAPTPVDETPTAVAPAEPPAEQAPVQGYSVAMAAYGDAAAAQALLDPMAAAMPDVLFMVVPVEVDGRVFHRVLAGPATDSADAEALLESIASTTGRDPAGWVLRHTPQAFLMWEMADVVAARQRAEELRALDVPAYVLVADYSDGSSRFRVYAGAYADEAEASLLLRHLTDSGVTAAHLSDRKGRLPE